MEVKLELIVVVPVTAQCQIASEDKGNDADWDLRSSHTKLIRNLEPAPAVAAPEMDVQGRMMERAGEVIKLLDQAASVDNFEADGNCDSPQRVDALGRARLLCGVRWRKSDAFSNLRSRYEGVNRTVKTSLFGKALADHVELDLDTSPEIKFEFRFD